MGDFPASVNTHTGGHYDNTQPRHGGLAAGAAMVDVSFVRSIPAILMMAEVLLGLIHWSVIVSSPVIVTEPYGWVLFVAITLWVLTIVLFFLIFFGVHRQIAAVPWTLVVMVYNAVATVLYLTAFAVNAAYVDVLFIFGAAYDHMAAASFFGFLTWVAYGGSAVLAFFDWKADSGRNAAPGNVPT
ncbi:plasmolipin [Salarias fasciatus]|uniref:Plasmolipin n=1 Tax=Salarias fasciatus TaxID=181472 RepID=A0A672I7P1_SALFA|nr:plasmolipin [Salarias fasciatus]